MAHNNNNPSTVIDPAWYFDTGATDHVSPNQNKLNIAEECKGDDKLQVGKVKTCVFLMVDPLLCRI